MDPTEVRLIKIYDNLAGDKGLTAAWGLSIWIESPGEVVLLDTGGDGRVLLDNLGTLGLDPGRIDQVVLSHFHADHTGGMAALTRAAAGFGLICPGDLSNEDRAALERAGVRVSVAGGGSLEVAPGVWTTGVLGEWPPEQGLVLDLESGLVVLTGCAHPGPRAMVDAAKAKFPGRRVDLLAGGFHLPDHQMSQAREVIDGLAARGVGRVAPGHCTGERVLAEMARRWGDGYVTFGCGRRIAIR